MSKGDFLAHGYHFRVSKVFKIGQISVTYVHNDHKKKKLIKIRSLFNKKFNTLSIEFFIRIMFTIHLKVILCKDTLSRITCY